MIQSMSEQRFYEKNEANEKRGGCKRTLFSTDLFRGAREIIIEHCGQYYRLQITKAGKLILNK